MTMKGIDLAWSRPDVDGIKATGAKWVARYFSNDPSKNLTAAEVKAYTAAGLAVIAIWEGTASEALGGRQKGIQNASRAKSMRAAVGLPDSVPIYFAVDSDVAWAQVQAYFDGVRSVLGTDGYGVYGGYKIVIGANRYGVKYLWQTLAWSNGLWFSKANIRQVGGTVLSGGADVDYSDTADFGQYPRPVPEDDMPITQADADLIASTILGRPLGKGTTTVGQELQTEIVKRVLAGVTVPQFTPAQITALAQALAPAVALELSKRLAS